MSQMNAAQKTIMREFDQKFFKLLEEYWNPVDSDEYWDRLTEEATKLIEYFQSSDPVTNNFLANIVVAFMNSREEMLV